MNSNTCKAGGPNLETSHKTKEQQQKGTVV